jgi:hypothetical protein
VSSRGGAFATEAGSRGGRWDIPALSADLGCSFYGPRAMSPLARRGQQALTLEMGGARIAVMTGVDPPLSQSSSTGNG